MIRCIKRAAALRALAAAALTFSAAAAVAAPTEYEVKAAFLVNLVRFVEWPFAEGPNTIVVIEPNPFGRVLETAAADATLPVRLAVKTIAPSEPVPPCRIVFAGKGAGVAGRDAIASADLGTLTVGETEEFLARGGIVRLAVIQGRVRVEINVDAAERSGLRMSSKLMKVATLRHEKELR